MPKRKVVDTIEVQASAPVQMKTVRFEVYVYYLTVKPNDIQTDVREYTVIPERTLADAFLTVRRVAEEGLALAATDRLSRRIPAHRILEIQGPIAIQVPDV